METTPGVRRLPVQQRSVVRVARILDACAQLLDEVGLDALTTREVARRARVPTATIYQFFDGKTGMMRQLALHHLDILLIRLRERATAETAPFDWPRAGEIIIEVTVAMRRTVPGFTVVDFSDARPGGETYLQEGSAEAGGDLLAETLYRFATEEAGLPPLKNPYRTTRLAIAATAAGLGLAFQNSKDGDPAMVEQTRIMLTAYFAAATP